MLDKLKETLILEKEFTKKNYEKSKESMTYIKINLIDSNDSWLISRNK